MSELGSHFRWRAAAGSATLPVPQSLGGSCPGAYGMTFARRGLGAGRVPAPVKRPLGTLSTRTCKDHCTATSELEEPFGVQPASAPAGGSLQPEGGRRTAAAASVPCGTRGSPAQPLVVLGARDLRQPPRLLENHSGVLNRRSPPRRLRRPGPRPACLPLGPPSRRSWIRPARLLAVRALPDVRTSIDALLPETRAGCRPRPPRRADDCRPPHWHLAHGVRPRRPAPGGNHPQRRLLESGRGRRGGGDRRRA